MCPAERGDHRARSGCARWAGVDYGRLGVLFRIYGKNEGGRMKATKSWTCQRCGSAIVAGSVMTAEGGEIRHIECGSISAPVDPGYIKPEKVDKNGQVSLNLF